MTRTHRPRRPHLDVYLTPPWVIAQLLDVVVPDGSSPVEVFGGLDWLEPSCGEFAIPRIVATWCLGRGCVAPRWVTCDIRPEVSPHVVGDFLEVSPQFDPGLFDVILGNPPFSLALQFVQSSLELAPVVGMLLRSQWLGTEDRNEWIRANQPWQGYISTRIKFNGAKKADAEEYCWFIWDQRPQPVFEPGRFVVFPYADADYRRRWEGEVAP